MTSRAASGGVGPPGPTGPPGPPGTPGATRYIYDASQYSGWHDDDSNDDSDAIQAAINDAVVTGGEVVIPARHGVLNKSGRTALTFPADMPYGIVIRGLGIDVTTIRLGLNTRTFLEPDGALTGNTHTYGKIEIRDLTIDAKNTFGTARPTNVAGHYGVLFSNAGIKANYDSISVRRCRTKNVGPLMPAGQTSTDGLATAITLERRNFDLTVGTTPDGLNGATAYRITNILLEDCDFGFTNPYDAGTGAGGGGSTGAIVQAFYGGADKVANKIYNTPWISNVWIENVTYRRCYWDSGQTPTASTQPSSSGMGSAGFMVGSHGQGRNWVAEECIAKNGGDPGYEFDSGLRTKLVRCYAEDCWNVGFYFANIGGGADTYGYANPEQHILVDACTAKRALCLNMQNLLVHQPKFATPHGTITVRDFTSITNLTDVPTVGQNAVEFRGDIRKLAITNLRSNMIIATSTALGTFTDRAVSIALRGGRSHVVVDGIYDDVNFTGSGGGTFVRPTLALHLADGVVDVKNVVRRHRFALTGGTTARSWDFDVFQTGGQNTTDAFGASSGSLANDYIDITGTGLADITQSGGTLNTPQNVSTEKRFAWLMASGNGSWQNTGPFTDQSFSVKSTPGPTISGHKAGVILKMDPRDPTTYLECYVTDNGTNSTLLIDKVIAGARTNLVTSASLGTRISNGTAFWVRGKITGNVITADYYTSAPAAISASGATTVTATLTGSDVYALGEMMQGRGGFSWVPKDSAATLDDLKTDWFQVVRGSFTKVIPENVVGPVAQAYGFNFEQAAGTWRYPGDLKISACDWTALEGNTSVVEMNFTDTTMKTHLLAAQNAYNTPPAAATITVSASPFTYTNSTQFRERVGIYSGTVSNVSLTDKGGTSTQLAGATNAAFTLDPGESLVVTYTGAPTMQKVPVR